MITDTGKAIGVAICLKVQSIRIELDRYQVQGPATTGGHPVAEISFAIHTGFQFLEADPIKRLIWNEGFRTGGKDPKPDIVSFVNFFRETYDLAPGKPFHGDLIVWKTPISIG